MKSNIHILGKDFQSPQTRKSTYYDKEIINILNTGKSNEKDKKYNNGRNGVNVYEEAILLSSQMKESMNIMLNNLEKLENKQFKQDKIKNHLISRNCHYNPYQKTINAKKIETIQTNNSKGKNSNMYTRENSSMITKINTPHIVTTKTSQNISKTNTTINSPIPYEKTKPQKNLKQVLTTFALDPFQSLLNNSKQKRELVNTPLENNTSQIIKSPFKVKRLPTKSELLLYGRNRNVSNSLSHQSLFHSRVDKCISRLSSSSKNKEETKKKFSNITEIKLNSNPNISKSLCYLQKNDKKSETSYIKQNKVTERKSKQYIKEETKIINIKINTKNSLKTTKYTFDNKQNKNTVKQRESNSMYKENTNIIKSMKLFSKKASQQNLPKDYEDSKSNAENNLNQDLYKKNTSNFVPRVLTSLYEDYNYDSDQQISTNKRKSLIRKLSEARKSKKIENKSSNSSSLNNIQTEDKKNILSEVEELRNSNLYLKNVSECKDDYVEKTTLLDKSNQISSYSMSLQRKSIKNNMLELSSKEEILNSNSNQISFPECNSILFYNTTKSRENSRFIPLNFSMKNLENSSSKATFSLSEIVNEVKVEILGASKFETIKESSLQFNKNSTINSLKVLRMNQKFNRTKERDINIAK